jgi:hypothetical protein
MKEAVAKLRQRRSECRCKDRQRQTCRTAQIAMHDDWEFVKDT